MEQLSTEAKDFFAKCANHFTEGERVLRLASDTGRKYFWHKDSKIERSDLKPKLAASYDIRKAKYFDAIVYDCLVKSEQTQNSFVYAFYKGESNGVLIVGDMEEFLIEIVPEHIHDELKYFCVRKKAFAEVTNQLTGVFKRNKNITQIRQLYPFEFEPIRADRNNTKAKDFIAKTIEESNNPPKSCKVRNHSVYLPAAKKVWFYTGYIHPTAFFLLEKIRECFKNQQNPGDHFGHFPHVQPNKKISWVFIEEREKLLIQVRNNDTCYLREVPIEIEQQCKAYGVTKAKIFKSPVHKIEAKTNVRYFTDGEKTIK
jgi:hypothetical protein